MQRQPGSALGKAFRSSLSPPPPLPPPRLTFCFCCILPALQVVARPARRNMVVRAGYLGSATNQVPLPAMLPRRRRPPAAPTGRGCHVICHARSPLASSACLFLPTHHSPLPSRCRPSSSLLLQIMVLSTFLPLVAGRFGLAPTSTRHTDPGCKLLPAEKSAGLYSADPAGEPPGTGSGRGGLGSASRLCGGVVGTGGKRCGACRVCT